MSSYKISLMKQLDLLRKNEEVVGKEVLARDYAKPYADLISRIKDLAYKTVLSELVLFQDYLKEENAPAYVEQVKAETVRLLSEEAAEFERALDILFSSYDYYRFSDVIFEGRIYDRFRYEVYAPYWKAKLRFDAEKQTYVDTIHDYVWDAAQEAWMKDSRFVVFGFRLLPPTDSLIEKERKESLERHGLLIA